MIAIVDGAESLLVWNSHVRASEAKNLCGTYMQVCEATWEGKKANVIGILAALFYLGDESKSNGVWGLHVHMYQLACVADGLEVMWLNLAG